MAEAYHGAVVMQAFRYRRTTGFSEAFDAVTTCFQAASKMDSWPSKWKSAEAIPPKNRQLTGKCFDAHAGQRGRRAVATLS